MAKLKELIRFDWFIKFMLRDKSDFEILSGFLSELLKEDVEVIDLLESESNQKEQDDKFNRVDLLVKTSTDELIIVEVQNEFQIDFLQRLLYGTSKATTEYIKKGENYSAIKRIISVSIVYFEIGLGKDYVYVGTTNFIGMHKKDILELSENQKTTFKREHINHIFPTYYLIRAEFFKDVINDKLDQWIFFFKNGKVLNDFNAKGLEKAAKVLDYAKMNEEEKKSYDIYYYNLRESNSYALTQRVLIREAEEKAFLDAKKETIINNLKRGRFTDE